MTIGTETLRLLRENWNSSTELAQELYVLLGDPAIPITTSAPITYTAPSPLAKQPALVINVAPGQPAINIPDPTGVGPGVTIGSDFIDLGGGVISNQGLPLANGPAGMTGTIQGPCGCPEPPTPPSTGLSFIAARIGNVGTVANSPPWQYATFFPLGVPVQKGDLLLVAVATDPAFVAGTLSTVTLDDSHELDPITPSINAWTQIGTYATLTPPGGLTLGLSLWYANAIADDPNPVGNPAILYLTPSVNNTVMQAMILIYRGQKAGAAGLDDFQTNAHAAATVDLATPSVAVHNPNEMVLGIFAGNFSGTFTTLTPTSPSFTQRGLVPPPSNFPNIFAIDLLKTSAAAIIGATADAPNPYVSIGASFIPK